MSTRKIPVLKTKKEIIVPEKDYAYLVDRNVSLQRNGQVMQIMHRSKKGGFKSVVSHIMKHVDFTKERVIYCDGDKYNCGLDNLRVIPITYYNLMQPPHPGKGKKTKGVERVETRGGPAGSYKASTMIQKKYIYLGLFQTEKEACLIRDAAIRYLYKDDSKNFWFNCPDEAIELPIKIKRLLGPFQIKQ